MSEGSLTIYRQRTGGESHEGEPGGWPAGARRVGKRRDHGEGGLGGLFLENDLHCRSSSSLSILIEKHLNGNMSSSFLRTLSGRPTPQPQRARATDSGTRPSGPPVETWKKGPTGEFQKGARAWRPESATRCVRRHDLVIPNRVKGDSLFGLGLRSESRRWPGKRGVDQDTARCFATISGARGALSRRPADFCERKRLEGQHSRRGISLPDAPRGRLRSIESPSPARDRQAPRNTSRPG